jgi:prepilin-type N-terminal cleavage/methylation domain-containing protein
MTAQSRISKQGFSMIELLAAVAIMGVIAFMAIPSVTKMRTDSERNLMISRAEALNIAQASFIQAEGRGRAEQQWVAATSDAAKYALIRKYLAFSETALTQYIPAPYTLQFPASLLTMQKCTLSSNLGLIRY